MSTWESVPRADLRQDFAGQLDLSMLTPATSGRTHFTLTARTVNTEAQEFFGNGFCLHLAGAVHSMTGWDLTTVYRRGPGENDFKPCHVGVMTPAGKFLDIFGHRTTERVRQLYLERDDVADVRLRTVHGLDFYADVLNAGEDTRGESRWWEAEFHTPGHQSVLLHFARLTVTLSGFRDCIRSSALPDPPQHVAPQHSSTTPATPRVQETVMSIPEEVARLSTIANAIPLGALEQLSQAELPPEARLARDQLSGLGGQVLDVVGNTSNASEAAALLSQAMAKISRAHEAYSLVQMHLRDALQSAAKAKLHVEEAARYHSH